MTNPATTQHARVRAERRRRAHAMTRGTHPDRHLSWTTLGARMGFTTNPSQRAEILSAINRMSWTSAPRRPPYFTSPALAAVVNAVVPRHPLRFVGISQLSRVRRLIGLHDIVGTRGYVLDLDSEAIYVLAEHTHQRVAITCHSDVA
jgi:hypothetical protein